MTLWLASDHRGFSLKEELKPWLKSQGLCFEDLGTFQEKEPVDYPIFAQMVAEKLSLYPEDLGILLCATGTGMAMAANKFPGIRAVFGANPLVARLSREHNCANVLTLGSEVLSLDKSLFIIKSWLDSSFHSEPRHVARIQQLAHKDRFWGGLKNKDPQVFDLYEKELLRQREGLELIASENFVSWEVLGATANLFTNKYAEGLPGHRYYEGCRHVDELENLAIKRLTQLFSCSFANVQPHSGAQANSAVFLALVPPGERIMGLKLDEGGHLTHGSSVNASGIYYESCFYGVDPHTGHLDYDAILRVAMEKKPKLIIAGASAYPRILDFEKFREIADACGAYLMVDMAHIAGLVATQLHPSPFPHAHVVTSTTHKTLRGPRGGIILWNDAQLSAKLNKGVFPGTQGGPLEHIIGAKAVAFGEALKEDFRIYQQKVLENSRALAEALQAGGMRLVTGGTDNHLILVDLRFGEREVTGKAFAELLESVGITANKNGVPGDERGPTITSGLRLGTPAVTTRGLGVEEMKKIASWILGLWKGDRLATDVAKEVRSLASCFPLYPFWN